MYQEDYILRHIRLFVQMIARVLGLIKDGDFELALTLIETAFRDHLGLSLQDFLQFPNDRVLDFLTFGELGTLGINKAGLAANLLFQAGLANRGKERLEESRQCFEKGLALLVELHLSDVPVQELPDFMPTVDAYIREAGLDQLPDDLLGALVFYFEKGGEYRQAEKALQVMVRKFGAEPETMAFTRSFYEYLLEEDETKLAEGGMDLDDVKAKLIALDKGLPSDGGG